MFEMVNLQGRRNNIRCIEVISEAGDINTPFCAIKGTLCVFSQIVEVVHLVEVCHGWYTYAHVRQSGRKDFESRG
jgi:hypothetical protein